MNRGKAARVMLPAALFSAALGVTTSTVEQRKPNIASRIGRTPHGDGPAKAGRHE